jgi:hypothetical protein
MRDDAGFSRARAGEDEKGTVLVLDRHGLGGIHLGNCHGRLKRDTAAPRKKD